MTTTKKTAETIAIGAWVCRYSHEDFDRTQSLAFALTQADRDAGRDAPAAGYSAARWLDAARAVKAAQIS